MVKATHNEMKKITTKPAVNVNKIDPIEELKQKIESMKKDKEDKCKAAKEQLINQLEITSAKYRTATGTMEALRMLRLVVGDSYNYIFTANKLAISMAEEVIRMKEKAEQLPYARMDEICDDFYIKDYKVDECEISETDLYDFVFELMRIDLCRNVGASAEDLVEFIKRTQEEIDAVGEQLKKLKN